MIDRAAFLLLLLLAVLSLAPAASQAQVYKWKDAEGRMQLGDKPPPGVQATQVSGKAATAPVKTSDEESKRQAQEQRDRWARVIHSKPGQVERRVDAGTRDWPQGPQKGNATHEAPQGDCQRYQYLQGLVRSRELHRCSGASCVKASPQEVEMIEREARLACGSR